MIKGKIRKVDTLAPELKSTEDFFIADAEEHMEEHFAKYRALESSIDGKYVCSDLFKETFPLYAASVESRSKYNRTVHNSAACLASEYFDRLVSSDEVKKCIFLSGVPGAGKSYLIQSIATKGEIDGESINLDDIMIYEGDITTPTIYEKLDKCVQYGKEIFVIIVNPTLELAQRNAIKRKFEIGRGASCETMARIISKIPKAIVDIIGKYKIELGIYNKKSNYDIEFNVGKEYAHELNRGNYDEILAELQKYRTIILEEMKNELGENKNDQRKI